jgi:cytochrome c oxidase subunit IV
MRWTLVILFMLLKAGFIISVFMHAMWERMALVFTILGPPIVLLLFIGFMAVEGDYVQENRFQYRGHDRDAVALGPDDLHGEEEAH